MAYIEDRYYQIPLGNFDSSHSVTERLRFKVGIALISGSCPVLFSIVFMCGFTFTLRSTNESESTSLNGLSPIFAEPPKRRKDRPGGYTNGNFHRSIWDVTQLQEMGLNTSVSRSAWRRLWRFLITNPDVKDFNDVPWDTIPLPDKAQRIIREHFHVYTTKVVVKEEAVRGDGMKMLVELQDGHRVETVIIRHKSHSTLCVSSQIGCAMGCKFCATGTLGIIGDLSAGEIFEQFLHANNILLAKDYGIDLKNMSKRQKNQICANNHSRLRNVVFMGQGEPLNNWNNVKLAVQGLIETYKLSPHHITVSTVGVTKAMRALTDELKHVNVALSLHAPNQEVRKQIVPSAAANSIDKLMEAVDYHLAQNKGNANQEDIDEVREIRDGIIGSLRVEGDMCELGVAKAPFSTANFIAQQVPGEKLARSGVLVQKVSQWFMKRLSIFQEIIQSQLRIKQPAEKPLISEDGIFNFKVAVKARTVWKKSKENKVMIEYILIKDINDRAEHAHELVQLLFPRRKHLLLNLIPYNPTDVAEEFETSEARSIQIFQKICAEGGIFTCVRQSRGQDISGACGQLALVTKTNKDRATQQEYDIEDLVGAGRDVVMG